MALVFPTAQVGQTTHLQHNHYDPEKFWIRDGEGRLWNRYQQRMMLVCEDFIVGYQQALEEEVGDAAVEIMYRCGYEWGKADVIGFEKRFNPMLAMDRQAFVDALTAEIPPPPADMAAIVDANLRGVAPALAHA